jgi:homoserine kinase
VISGAGPTLLALSMAETASTVAHRIQKAWQQSGITAKVAISQIEIDGAVVQPIFE